ncbi:MAG: entericidin [Betaproteobacteria bacterium RIFCSPLOWO2_12_FULL_62_58]|nr:MAG: entericidin [Betaproteobacteria bacterium RIFCSPLOWO2_12_FULL_62_58]
MKKLAALFIMLVIGVLAGCNTMQGLGKDIERGGEKLQGTAQDAKEKM